MFDDFEACDESYGKAFDSPHWIINDKLLMSVQENLFWIFPRIFVID